jgi:hypothetical protein
MDVKTPRFSTTSPTFMVDQLSYHKETRTFVGEISSLDKEACDFFTIYNPKTGNKRTFVFEGTDRSDRGEDVCGWRYSCIEDRSIKALIIND